MCDSEVQVISYKPGVLEIPLETKIWEWSPCIVGEIRGKAELVLENGSREKPELSEEDEVILSIAERIPEAKLKLFITWFNDFYIKWKKEWKKEFYEWCSGLEIKLADLLILRINKKVNLFY